MSILTNYHTTNSSNDISIKRLVLVLVVVFHLIMLIATNSYLKAMYMPHQEIQYLSGLDAFAEKMTHQSNANFHHFSA